MLEGKLLILVQVVVSGGLFIENSEFCVCSQLVTHTLFEGILKNICFLF